MFLHVAQEDLEGAPFLAARTGIRANEVIGGLGLLMMMSGRGSERLVSGSRVGGVYGCLGEVDMAILTCKPVDNNMYERWAG